MAKKECSGCGSMLGVRTKECPDCGHKFLIRKRGPRPKQIDWTELKAGDTIKVVTGTGPYFLSKITPGEKIMMGQKGVFEVVELYGVGARPKGCGIVGRQITGKKHRAGVVEYIYMGVTWYNDDLSIHEEPHKVLGVQTEATIIEKPNKKKRKTNKKATEVDVSGLNDLIASL
tara:strand:- start:7826 stop:8344 length:519 start_codon:yes stop_codon:yes gene_type:complete